MKLHNEQLIKKWEQLRLEAYLPTPNDVWTIGWGHTQDVYKGMVISEAQAQTFFEEDVQWAEDAVNKYVKVGLNQNQFDALVSLTFNIGATAFKNSTVVRRLNAGDYEGAAEAMAWWNKQKGKTLRGLVRRRAQEKEYFLTPTQEVEKSAKPDNNDSFKPLWKSKEIWTAVGASLSGVVAGLGGWDPKAQLLLVGALIVAGGLIAANRVWARRKGQR